MLFLLMKEKARILSRDSIKNDAAGGNQQSAGYLARMERSLVPGRPAGGWLLRREPFVLLVGSV